MWWMALAQAGMALAQGSVTKATIEANSRLSKVNAQASNTTRQRANELAAAQAGLARWVQSVNNNRVLEAGGQELEASVVNYRRNRDALATQSFSDSIRQAEQAGAAAAAQAVAGIEGNVVDMVNGATALRDSIVNESMRRTGEMLDSDQARRAGQITAQTIQGMDSSLILDSLDYNVDVAQYQSPKMAEFQAKLKAVGYLYDAAKEGAAMFAGGPAAAAGTSKGTFNGLSTEGESSGPRLGSFSFSTTETSRSVDPYSMWGASGSSKLGGDRDTADSIYGLWSR